MKRLEQIANDFMKALAALEDAARQAKSELEIDGTIQRFEFSFELFWKLLKVYLEGQGLIVRTPRDSFKEAFRLGIVDDEAICLRMLDDRNLTVHLYDEQTSREVFVRIKNDYVKLLQGSLDKMKLKG